MTSGIQLHIKYYLAEINIYCYSVELREVILQHELL